MAEIDGSIKTKKYSFIDEEGRNESLALLIAEYPYYGFYSYEKTEEIEV